MTTNPLCDVDGRPVADRRGRLCIPCWADLDYDLCELIESLARDLDITIAGLGKSGGSPIGIVVRSADRGVGFNEQASDIARDLRLCLGGWVRVLREDMPRELRCTLCGEPRARHAAGPMPEAQDWIPAQPPWPRDNLADLARWLIRHRRHVREHEAVADLHAELTWHIAAARRVIDRRPDKRYLGVCSAHLETIDGDEYADPPVPTRDVICDADLYALDGHATITCRTCGTTHDVADRRAVLLAAIDDQLGTAAEIARALAAYADIDLRVERVRQWYSRGKIAQYPPRDSERSPRYRVGDVRALVDPAARKAS